MSSEILLVEDDDSLNRAISLKLSKEGYTVHSAMSVKEAEEAWKAHKVPLVICDVDLPDGKGWSFCEKVRAEGDVVFLFLTAMDSEEDIVKGYAVGADDYITKPFYMQALVSKIHAIMRRYVQAAELEVLVSGSISLSVTGNRVRKNEEYITLTAKEQKLLFYFMKNPMRILSKNQLLEALWDVDGDFVDDNKLAVYIHRLREKLEDDPSAPVYLKNVRGLGYIWEQDVRGKKENGKFV